MYVIDFKKERAEEIMAAIQSGGPIPAPPDGWNRYEMQQVAGAMYFALWSQGPVNTDLERFEKLPLEHREATEETFTQDVHDSIEFVGQLTMMVTDNEYDSNCEPHVQVAGTRDESGAKKVKFFKGQR